ncbi:putative glyco_18 [Lyophyllum shimeji]|uniref:Glyco_18 n=1 Tax=Lyophyllum shimeji TaxID=47721 RepID=A0A9P3UTS7_LYOSH|nr:putative glyco_18 [Lyophyllum shimeji]
MDWTRCCPECSKVGNLTWYIHIIGHTTASSPGPHILYVVKVTFKNGQQSEVVRRYSQFASLRKYLGDAFDLPPKRVLANVIVPFTWVDDDLIAERTIGLEAYLNNLNATPEFYNNDAFLQFLSSPSFDASTLPAYVANAPVMVSRSVVTIDHALEEPETRPGPIAAAYYPTWAVWSNPPNKLNFAKFDMLFFAFVAPNASSTLKWPRGGQDTLRRLVFAARKSGKGTKIVLSVGGWGGSYWFSNAVKTQANRTQFIHALVEAVNSFGLDGVDIDWEYPNSKGAGNPHSSADSENFLSLLKLLRASLGPSKIISAAVAHVPWLGTDGRALSDVTQFAAFLTYANIMNYDVFGASSKPGPNAPLGNLCGTAKDPQASAHSAFVQWTKAGFPASKLLLGLPLYGYVSKSTAKKLSGSLLPDSPPDPVAHPRGPATDRSTAPAGDLSQMWGQQIPFKQLVQSGALQKNEDGTYTAANGYTHCWDDCSDTPFLFNVARKTVVTYDDPFSIASKTQFARRSGMAGCFTWSLDQDDGSVLQDVIRAYLGKA